MDPDLRQLAEAARGFMPKKEGLALYEAALNAKVEAPLLEIGSYCGKSAVYLGAAAKARGQNLFCIDHHRGSEENQPGWEHHEPDLIDPETQKMDTLPLFRKTIYNAGLEENVIALVGDSMKIAHIWKTPLSFLFIDGGHGKVPAHNDYKAWSPLVATGGTLAIHDVFENPAEGGRPPFEIYRRALESGAFTEVSATGSLRVLEKS